MTEFSRLVPVESGMEAGTEGTPVEIEAGPEERAALAARFGLLSLDHLSATGLLYVFDDGHAARLEARIAADVVQACVVTLEPVASHIDEGLSVLYTRPEMTDAEGTAAKDVRLQLEEEDEPEPITDSGVDVGEAVAQCLGLALDLYPRAADADAVMESLGDVLEDREQKLPFEALAKLKKK
jgi:uncharacterized metal-binding protein YceD (DUF177 family)